MFVLARFQLHLMQYTKPPHSHTDRHVSIVMDRWKQMDMIRTCFFNASTSIIRRVLALPLGSTAVRSDIARTTNTNESVRRGFGASVRAAAGWLSGVIFFFELFASFDVNRILSTNHSCTIFRCRRHPAFKNFRAVGAFVLWRDCKAVGLCNHNYAKYIKIV